MSKPGPRELFESKPMTVDEFVTQTKVALDTFSVNMKHLLAPNFTDFEWFYMFGYWNEALEFIDEYPEHSLKNK